MLYDVVQIVQTTIKAVVDVKCVFNEDPCKEKTQNVHVKRNRCIKVYIRDVLNALDKSHFPAWTRHSQVQRIPNTFSTPFALSHRICRFEVLLFEIEVFLQTFFFSTCKKPPYSAGRLRPGVEKIRNLTLLLILNKVNED